MAVQTTKNRRAQRSRIMTTLHPPENAPHGEPYGKGADNEHCDFADISDHEAPHE